MANNDISVLNIQLYHAYLAGIIDGEGCIRIKKYLDKRGGTWTYGPVVKVSMTDRGPIDIFKSLYGGTITIENPKDSRHKVAYRWQVQSRHGCKKLIEDIKPYLTVKGSQAKLLIEFIDIHPRKIGRLPVDEARNKSMDLYFMALKLLNGSIGDDESRFELIKLVGG